MSLGLSLLGTAATAQPAPGTPLHFPMPSLNEPGVRRNFESRVSEMCRSAFRIEEITAANGTARDTFVCQTPPPKTSIGCHARVRVYISNGMPSQPTYDEKTGLPAPIPCREPVDDGLTSPVASNGAGTGTIPATNVISPTDPGGAQPQSPKTPTNVVPVPAGDTADPGPAATTWPMADLSRTDGEAQLEADTQKYCQRAAAMQERVAESGVLEGALVGQSPQPGTLISCVTPIIVVRSDGVPCRPTLSLSFRRLFAGDRCERPIVSVRTLAAGVTGLVLVGLVIRILWPKPPKRPTRPNRPKGDPTLSPTPYIVAGTPQITNRPDAHGLQRAAPDVELESAEATVLTTAQTPLGIQTVEICDG